MLLRRLAELFIERRQRRFEFGCQPKIGCVIGGKVVAQSQVQNRCGLNLMKRNIQCVIVRQTTGSQGVQAVLVLFQSNTGDFHLQQKRCIQGAAVNFFGCLRLPAFLKQQPASALQSTTTRGRAMYCSGGLATYKVRV